jgi:hypothetical protein
MGYQLELIDVSKLFGDVRAVDNVSLHCWVRADPARPLR